MKKSEFEALTALLGRIERLLLACVTAKTSQGENKKTVQADPETQVAWCCPECGSFHRTEIRGTKTKKETSCSLCGQRIAFTVTTDVQAFALPKID
jgi:uncharacterized protein (DUF983 family)